MPQSLTFVTGNKVKAEILAKYLDFPITHKSLDLPEIQSLDLAEIVQEKARAAYNILKTPVLVEDSALTFLALGKLPGPFVKWFFKEIGNQGLCELLGDKSRDARAEVVFALYDGETCHLFEGVTEGTISPIPRGEEKFGWDPIFIPKGHSKTRGEMNEEEQKATSMRQIALEKLAHHLAQSDNITF